MSLEDDPGFHPTLLRMYDDDLNEVPIGEDHPILLQALLRVNLCGQLLSLANRSGVNPQVLPELIQFVAQNAGWSLEETYTTFLFYLICTRATPPNRGAQP